MKPLQELIRDRFAPVLKARGFKRSAGTFRAVTDRGSAMIAIRGRAASSAREVVCIVEIGFVPADHFDAQWSGRPADKIDVTDTYATFHTRLRDPSRTAMDINSEWRFDRDDTEMVDLMTTVLEMAADDVLSRMKMWPAVPVDSLSLRPVFSTPVEWETRSRWKSDAQGQLDLHYAATSPVMRRRGFVGTSEFGFDLLHDDMAGTIQAGMIHVDPESVGLLTGGRPMAEWAPSVGLLPLGGHAAVPLSPEPRHVALIERGLGSTLQIDGAARHPEARFELGHFILPSTSGYQDEQVQIIFVADDPGCLHRLTFRSRLGLAKAGKAWWATVWITRDDRGEQARRPAD